MAWQAQGDSDQLAANREGPGAQPSFNLAPEAATLIWLLIRAGLGWRSGWIDGRALQGAPEGVPSNLSQAERHSCSLVHGIVPTTIVQAAS
jgi:hypothetical protein